MNATRHPSEELWQDYRSGQLDAASRRVLEGHVAACRECSSRGVVQVSAEEGFFPHLPAPAPASPVLDSILARVRQLPPLAQPTAGPERLPIPRVFWPLLPQLPGTGWRGALTPGFRYLDIPLPEGPHLYLIHLRRGRRFPRHGHAGVERSVVLCGGLKDGRTLLEAGDFDEASHDRVHRPEALPDEDCWILASLQGTLRFTGWRGWLQAMMT